MLENSKSVKSRNRRVVNGLAVNKSWDWIVRLEFFTNDSSLSSLCGGTVIHRNFVLTAGHCCAGKDSVLMSFKESIFLLNRTLNVEARKIYLRKSMNLLTLFAKYLIQL